LFCKPVTGGADDTGRKYLAIAVKNINGESYRFKQALAK
jgi:hypothetical protein